MSVISGAVDQQLSMDSRDSKKVHPVLENRNLQLYFGGQIISMTGSFMQQMAMSWLIYSLTKSSLMLGLIGFASQVPSLLVTPFAGTIIDRSNRHKLLIVTQVAALVQAATLSVLVLTGQAQMWELITLSAILGVITAFDLPARQTFIVDMLKDQSQLPTVIGVNSSITTLSRLIGPFVAGLMVAWTGEGICFLLNALSYIAVIAALIFIKTYQTETVSKSASPIEELKEGFRYAFATAPIRDLILLVGMFGLVAMPFIILLPAYVKDIFHGNAAVLGFMNAASGIGSVVAAVMLAARKAKGNLAKWVLGGAAFMGLGLTAFGFSTNLFLSLPLLAVMGFGSMFVMAGSNTLIQTIVDKDKRGRVMSIFVMALMGMTPFGCIAAGALANVIGVGHTLSLTGVLAMMLAAFFTTRLDSWSNEKGSARIIEEIKA